MFTLQKADAFIKFEILLYGIRIADNKAKKVAEKEEAAQKLFLYHQVRIAWTLRKNIYVLSALAVELLLLSILCMY